VKSLALAYLLFFVSLFFFSWKQNQASPLQPVEETLLEMQQSNTGPHVVITETHWSHLVHQLWHAGTPSLVLPIRDVKNNYLRKKKSFRCQHPVFWLGEQKPPKKLKSLGQWKSIKSASTQKHGLHLYQVQ
tara:strand:- start:407 stop:799 length:393 start_codon:yes stop_codon:yes gene_type:complete